MTLQERYRQASKEAKWVLALTIFYLIGWCIFAYFTPRISGPMGFPLWFELSCIYLPVLFIVIIHWVIKIVFVDIELDIPRSQNKE